MNNNLLIVFAKNKLFGKVKTRLAKTIGDQAAFEVYEKLYHITEKESCAVSNAAVQVHYSHEIDAEAWEGCEKFVQEGGNLGERMKAAFKAGFKAGFTNIIGVGADLPEINTKILENAFKLLDENDFVFGPAEDGGYYLVGMTLVEGLYIFENKPWSTSQLMSLTETEIKEKGNSYTLLETMNDIDTVQDLEKSNMNEEFKNLLENKAVVSRISK